MTKLVLVLALAVSAAPVFACPNMDHAQQTADNDKKAAPIAKQDAPKQDAPKAKDAKDAAPAKAATAKAAPAKAAPKDSNDTPKKAEKVSSK